MRNTIRWKNRGYHLPVIEIKTGKEKQLSEKKIHQVIFIEFFFLIRYFAIHHT